VMRNIDGNDVFYINDFDDAYLGTYLFDLRRMAVSILLAANENGLSSNDAQDVVLKFLESYLNWINIFKSSNFIETYVTLVELNNTNGVVNELIQSVAGIDRSSLLSKYTKINNNGQRLFQTTSELQPLSSASYAAISDAMTVYYNVKDICQKFGSGIGSLGRYRYYLLIEGPSSSTDDDLILEMKQETSSAVAIAVGDLPFGVAHEGERVSFVSGQLGNTDSSLDYATVNHLEFFVREKSPYQKDFDYTKLTTKTMFMDAIGYAGKVVAKSHSLSAGYYWVWDVLEVVRDKDAEFKTEIVNFAVDYAIQVEFDYESFRDALNREVPLY